MRIIADICTAGCIRGAAIRDPGCPPVSRTSRQTSLAA
jgi:hypothetical protein